MKRYMERIWELMNNAGAKRNIPLYDETVPKGISYEQLRIISGRVYAYLKSHNIGKEDFVLIKLPRGVQPIIATIGVWRAGAALVIVEDTLAPERIAYIYNDCNCKIAITSEVWEESINMSHWMVTKKPIRTMLLMQFTHREQRVIPKVYFTNTAT